MTEKNSKNVNFEQQKLLLQAWNNKNMIEKNSKNVSKKNNKNTSLKSIKNVSLEEQEKFRKTSRTRA